MSSKSNGLENALLLLIFNNDVPASGVLDDISDGIDASPTDGSLYVSLHTADPGEAGDQTTSEATIQNYARIAVARTTAGWTVSSNAVSNAAQIRFPASGTFGSTNAPNTIKFAAVGTDSTGAGNLLYMAHLGESPFPFNGTASDDNLVAIDHDFVDDDEVFIFENPGAGALPTGLSRGLYFVITPSGDTFQVETSIGGGAVNITADGSGYIAKVLGKEIDDADAFTFEIGDLDIEEY